jgi:hypothetical protein
MIFVGCGPSAALWGVVESAAFHQMINSCDSSRSRRSAEARVNEPGKQYTTVRFVIPNTSYYVYAKRLLSYTPTGSALTLSGSALFSTRLLLCAGKAYPAPAALASRAAPGV